jgi:predicted nucleotide-binding protein
VAKIRRQRWEKFMERIFVASSSEGLDIAETVKELLEIQLQSVAGVHLWTGGTFEDSKAYIESLESELNNATFAVLVLTEDDKVLNRRKKQWVPRDNLVFELACSWATWAVIDAFSFRLAF